MAQTSAPAATAQPSSNSIFSSNATTTSAELRLYDPPKQIISSVCFSPSQSQGIYLLASSWDGSVRLYNLETNAKKLQFDLGCPQLDCTFMDPLHSASGGTDNKLYVYDHEMRKQLSIGEHSEPIRCLDHNAANTILLSGSWDKTVRIWDPRSPSNRMSMQQPERVYSMHSHKHLLIVGTAERHIVLWDIRKIKEPLQKRESSLKYQTRVVRLSNDGEFYCVGSIEGRVAVEYVDPDVEVQKKKYAFRCHRRKNDSDGMDEAYPVNAIAFHPQFGTFATGGCDGMVFLWDGAKRKRLCQLKKQSAPVSALSFNRDGMYLAYGVSHMYDNEVVPEKVVEDYIGVRRIGEEARAK